MYEDDPQEKVFDVFGEAVFGSDPLGRAIIGRAEVIAGTPQADIAQFHRERYVPANVVIAAAGSVDHDALVELGRERTGEVIPSGAGPPAPAPPATDISQVKFEPKDTEQYHVCIGAPGISRHDDRRFALRLLDTVFGGTSSSRLFQEVREQRGLAYAVYSFTGAYQDSGQVGLYLGTRADNLAEALAVVGAELEHMRQEPATDAELARAKDNLKGRVVLALESTGARMNRLGSEILAGGEMLSIDETLQRIEAVTSEQLVGLARELWAPERLSAAGIGPHQGAFEDALSAVGMPLASTP